MPLGNTFMRCRLLCLAIADPEIDFALPMCEAKPTSDTLMRWWCGLLLRAPLFEYYELSLGFTDCA